MKPHSVAILGTCSLLGGCLPSEPASQAQLYTLSAQQVGLPFDTVVTEISRTVSKSYLQVPGFNDRTAAQSRWLMCVYTDVAIQRDFDYWTAVYPPENDPAQDQIVLAFSNSATSDPAQLLGEDFAADRTFPEMTSVAAFAEFCGLRK